jgi:hypothetical protein
LLTIKKSYASVPPPVAASSSGPLKVPKVLWATQTALRVTVRSTRKVGVHRLEGPECRLTRTGRRSFFYECLSEGNGAELVPTI